MHKQPTGSRQNKQVKSHSKRPQSKPLSKTAKKQTKTITKRTNATSTDVNNTNTTAKAPKKLYDVNPNGLYSFNGKTPQVTQRTFIAPSAKVIGDVKIGQESTILDHVTIRGDNDTMTIGHYTNIQENSILHTDPGLPVTLGNYVTVGHNAVIHGCTIGDNTLIGMGAIIMNRAVVGKNCIIGAGAVVLEKANIPDGSIVVGSPAKVIKTGGEAEAAKITENAMVYANKVDHFFQMQKVTTPKYTEIDPNV